MASAPSFGKVCPVFLDNSCSSSSSTRFLVCSSRYVSAISAISSSSSGRSSAVHRLNASSLEAATSSVVNTASSSGDSVRWAQLALQGPRSEMEDDLQIESTSLPGFTYAAIFDGHAGYSSVSFLKDELLKECVQALQGGALLQSDDFTALQNALSQAFLQADKRLISCRLEEAECEKDSGSTATILLLGDDKAVVAHVGDSRLVLSRGGKAEVLTADHRPYGNSKAAVSEVKRIRAAGGWISNCRVCGSLAVSRAFGNISLKTRRQEMLQQGLQKGRWTSKFVSKLDLTGDWLEARPDVATANLGQDAEFLILATDGLWDSVKSSEAVNLVRDQLREHGDAQRACEALAAAALGRNGQDNVSIVIADLGKVQQQQGFSQQQNLVITFQQVLITSGILLLGMYMTQLAGS